MTTKKGLNLKQQLAQAEKQKDAAQKKVDAIKKKMEASKPKSIMETVKTMKDVLRLAKPTKEENDLLKYSGKSTYVTFAKNVLVLALIAKVLNEDWEPKMDGTENRYYPYFWVSSGFVFVDSGYGHDHADVASAARLCFKTRELADFAGKVFEKEYKAVIMG